MHTLKNNDSDLPNIGWWEFKIADKIIECSGQKVLQTSPPTDMFIWVPVVTAFS